MASRQRDVLLRLRGDSSDARRAANEVREDMRRLGRERVRARVDLETSVVTQKIKDVEARLADLGRREPSPKVNVQTLSALRQLDRLNLRLDRLALKRVSVDVDVRRGAVERTAAELGSLERGLGGVTRGFANVFHQVPILGGLLESVFGGAATVAENLGTAVASVVTRGLGSLTTLAAPIGSVVGSVVSLGTSLIGLVAVGGAVVIALNAIIGAIVALGGALVALVASAAAAAAGLGALAVAFGAVLIPIALVAFGVFQRFQAILKARQAHEQELTQAVQAQKTAEQQRKAALDQVHQAEQGVTQALQSRKQAEQTLAQTIIEGHRAAAQAIFDERNAQLALEDSRLGLRGARLGVLDARKALKDLLAQTGATGKGLEQLFKQFTDVHVDPTKLQSLLGAVTQAGGTKKVDPLALAHAILNVQQAQQGVKDAVNQTANAERALAEATRRRAEFARRGLQAYAPYRQALAGVRRADDEVASAEHRLSQAQDRSAAAQTRSTAAQDKYARALKDLTPTEQGTLSRLDQLIKGFEALAKAFTDPIFRALNDTFDKLKSHAGDFTGVLRTLGAAFGTVIRAIGRFLAEPRTISAFKTMAAGAADLVRELGAHAFISFLRIMREIALAALPAVQQAARGVSHWLARIASQPGAIHKAVRGVVSQFRTWLGLAGAVAKLVIDFFAAAAPAGQALATSLRHVVDRWDAWIRANPERVRRFFRDAVAKAREIVGWLKNAFIWLRDHLPAAAAKAQRAFEALYKVVKVVADVVGGIQKASSTLAGVGSGRNLRIDIGPKIRQIEDPTKPRAARIQLGLSLLELEISTDDRKKIEKLLRNLGFRGRFPSFDQGGIVPGPIGRPQLALLHGGEFVLKQSIARQLYAGMNLRMNSGLGSAVPAPAAAGTGDIHVDFNVTSPPGTWIDERHVMAVARMHFQELNRAIAQKA